MKYKLKDIAVYSNKKIKVNKINKDTYISTENMLPNKSGVVKATKLPNQSKTNFFENKNILISNIRPYFKKIWFANFNGGCSNDVLNIKIKDETKVLPKYLYYNLLQDSFFEYIMSGSKGTKMPRGDKEHIMEYIINIPDINKQTKIVNILDKLNLKIELNNQINNNLFKLIKNMYFKMQKDMTEFEIVKLKDIANISSGKRPKNKGDEYAIPLIGANGIMSYTEEYNSNSDILVIGRVGTLGVVQRYFDKIWLSDNTLIINSIYSNVLENYLKYVDYQSLNRGSTQPLITQTDISNLDIKFSKNEFNRFEKEVIKLRKKIELNNKQNKILEQLRDTLLPKLMNAEIDLTKIEV